jgi:hypothetical protein
MPWSVLLNQSIIHPFDHLLLRQVLVGTVIVIILVPNSVIDVVVAENARTVLVTTDKLGALIVPARRYVAEVHKTELGC